MAPGALMTRLVTTALCAVVALSLIGCSRSSETPEPEPDRLRAVYDVRGRVTMLPDAATPTSEFRVHHEPIPDFRDNFHADPVGMNAMIMPFPLGAGETLEGIEVGHVVLVTFEVLHESETGELVDWRAIRVRRLDDETELDLGRVRRDGDE
ncbi:MAG: hypothetical protein EA379_05895 [Phycisphaerales bacterium]|nr:MAG: hypothetical protein EA379_05895 [Phycisphaerales bacterium]